MTMAGSGSFELTVTVILLLLIAFFALGPAIQALYPGRREVVEKAAPAAGLIGVIGLLWGIWTAVRTLFGIGMIGDAPLVWLFLAVGALNLVALGFLLSYSLWMKHLQARNEALAARGSHIQQRISAYQVPLGLAALFLAGFHLALVIGLSAMMSALASFGQDMFPTPPP